MRIEASIVKLHAKAGTRGKGHPSRIDDWKLVNEFLVKRTDVGAHGFLIATSGHGGIDVDARKQGQRPRAVMQCGGNIKCLGEIYLEDPCVGSRRLVTLLEREHGIEANRKRIMRLRRKMGIETIWCKPKRTSIPDNGHRKYPYLLGDRIVECADAVWCADITYVPMPHGHAYLCAVMDWHSRKVLGWAVSNTMDSALTGKALAAAVAQCLGLPEIFNTDQGSQFTSPEWTGRLEGMGIAVSMDGKGRWMDNVFIERLWRSVKYEDIYLKGYATIGDLEAGIRKWIDRYNTWRPHQALGNKTPAHVYETNRKSAIPATGMKKIA